MREPANKSLLTDVSGFCFHLCTIIHTDNSPQLLEKTLHHASTLDMGHKRMRFSLLKHKNLMLRSERSERLEAWAASDSPILHSQY